MVKNSVSAGLLYSGFLVEMGEMLSKLVPEGGEDRREGKGGENIT